MDNEDARRLIESGRISELSIYDLVALEYSLSQSTDPEDIALLNVLRGGREESRLPELSLKLQKQIEANYTAINNLEQNFNLLALDKNGRPQAKELLSIFNFFNRVDIENKPGTEAVSQENLFQQTAAVARVSALEELYRDETFAKKSAEEQKKIYIENVVMAMEEKAFVLLSNQVVENVTERKNSQITPQEKAKIKSEVTRRFAACIDVNSQARFKLSNNNIIGTLVTEVNRAANTAEFHNNALKSSRLAENVLGLDDKLTPHYKESFMRIRPLAQTPNMSLIAGPVGRSAFGAANIQKVVSHKNPARGSGTSLFTFLRENPIQFRMFSENLFGTIKKAYNNLNASVNFGIVSDKISSGWKNMIRYFSNRKDGKAPEAYNGLTLSEVGMDLRTAGKQIDGIMQKELSAEEKVYAWKEFGRTFRNSKLGQTLNPGRYELVPERVEDYTSIVKIDLNKKKTSSPKAFEGEGIPQIITAQVQQR